MYGLCPDYIKYWLKENKKKGAATVLKRLKKASANSDVKFF